ncbi:MAG TPA: mammalian cell entry protein [Mycobacterium sp.]|jgi:Mce-associated membrane protein
MSAAPSPPTQAVRRRASRAAGPAKGGTAETTTVRIEQTDADGVSPKRKGRTVSRPGRRPAHRRLVALWALAFGFVACAAVAAPVALMMVQKKHTEATQVRDQRFVDTATQTVVNMFSFKQSNIADSVDRFYAGTSGPLRDMLSRSNNVENLKLIFHDTGGSSEAVINGAALESIDPVSNNASVLVSARVTIADMNGNNRPSQPYRLRIIVHEDDNGGMTAYDLKYPNGGN